MRIVLSSLVGLLIGFWVGVYVANQEYSKMMKKTKQDTCFLSIDSLLKSLNGLPQDMVLPQQFIDEIKEHCKNVIK